MTVWGVPTLPAAVIPRPRLLEGLERDAAVVVLRAPAGYGKTVALAQWAASTERTGVWSRIREDGTDAPALVKQLSEDFAAAGLLDETSPLAAAVDAISGGADPWDLLRRALRRLDRPVALALDQADKLTDDVLETLLDTLADAPNLIIRATARRRSPLSEPAHVLEAGIHVIGMTELALTDIEAARILGVDASSEPVAAVAAGGGAPILARVMALSSPSGAADAGGTSAELIDSLLRVRSRVEGWDDEFIGFLLSISPADAVSVELAQELSELAHSQDLLDRAEEHGLGMWSRGEREALFVLSPLVRERFARRLQEARPAAASDLRARVAAWAMNNSQPHTALRLAIGDRRWPLASEVIRRYWPELLQGAGVQVRTLFRSVSIVSLRSWPLITMMLALSYNASRRHRIRALEYFAVSALAARDQRATASPPDRALLRTIESAAWRVSGRAAAAETAASEAYTLLTGMTDEERDVLGRSEATLFNQVGTTFFYAGRAKDALDCFERSASTMGRSDIQAGLQGLALQAGTSALLGDMPEAAALTSEASTARWPERWIDGYPGTFYQLAHAVIALEDFDVERAEAHIRALDPHRETIEHWPALAHLDAMVGLLRGVPESALLRLDDEEAKQRRRQAASPVTLQWMNRTRALLHVAAGDLDRSADVAARLEHPVARAIALARLALVREDPEKAWKILQGVPIDGDHVSRDRAELLSVRAGAIVQLGGAGVQTVLDRLVEYLDDRKQSFALALVPAGALDAMAKTATRAGTASRFEAVRVPRLLAVRRPAPRLTPREVAVARELMVTDSTTAIAAALYVSPNTVKSQLRSLYRKLDVSTRAAAISALAVHNLIDDGAPPRER